MNQVNTASAFQSTVDQLANKTTAFSEGEYDRTIVEMGTKMKVVEAKAEKTTKVKKAAKAEKPKSVSKRSIAANLYAAAKDKSRQAMLEVFMTELNVSKANASVYFYHVSK